MNFNLAKNLRMTVAATAMGPNAFLKPPVGFGGAGSAAGNAGLSGEGIMIFWELDLRLAQIVEGGTEMIDDITRQH